MQAKAPEFFKIEILRVDVAPGETPTEQRGAIGGPNQPRSSDRRASAKPNEIINIVYT